MALHVWPPTASSGAGGGQSSSISSLGFLAETEWLGAGYWGTFSPFGDTVNAKVVYVQLLDRLFNTGEVVTGIAYSFIQKAVGGTYVNTQLGLATADTADNVTIVAATADFSAALYTDATTIIRKPFASPYTVAADGTALYAVISCEGAQGATSPLIIGANGTQPVTTHETGQPRPRYWRYGGGSPITVSQVLSTWSATAPVLWWLGAY